MATQKKQKEMVIRIQDQQAFDNLIDPNLNKLVILNVYEKFWGPVDVLDKWLERYLDDEIGKKVIFAAVNKDMAVDLWGKTVFSSKPIFFILHRGVVLDTIDVVDITRISEKIENNIKLI